MKTFWPLWIVGLSLCVPAATALEPGIATPAVPRGDRLLVKPKSGVDPAAIDEMQRQLGGRVHRRYPALQNLQVIDLPSVVPVQQMIVRLQRSGLVEYAEPDYTVRALAVPNDFRYANRDQWNLHNTGIYGGVAGADVMAEAAWDLQHDADNVIVAVLDSGIRTTHEDLAPNLWVNPGESGNDAAGRDKRSNGIDDDGNGYIDDVHGINAIIGSGNPADDWGHGTHVAGIIGARGNNSLGIAGVAWRVKLLACKFIDASGNASIADAIEAMEYARARGARIINASWGGYSFTSAALRDAFASLRNAGIIVAAAAGNDNNSNDTMPLYPASYDFDNIVAVAATDRTDARAPFSNFGASSVDLAAPGAPVFSCWAGSNSDYRNWDGTSMAAPHVAAACALLWARFPNETYQQIIGRVLSTVDPLPALSGKTVSGGRLNLAAALGSGSAPPPPPPPPPPPSPPPPPDPSTTPPGTVWIDDAIPAGAWTTSIGGDGWNWVSSSPTPFSGSKAHQTNLTNGYHDHSFSEPSVALDVFPGDILYAYVYIDPANPPAEIMISWNNDRRAYWGENLLPWGTNGTPTQMPMGPLPATGQWVRLEVPAAQLGLEGVRITSMTFALVNGRVTWDAAGRRAP